MVTNKLYGWGGYAPQQLPGAPQPIMLANILNPFQGQATYFYIYIIYSSLIPLGPQLAPKFLNKPIRIYMPNLNRNLIGVENRNRTIIYQWINLINGKLYVGSAWRGSQRLLTYWSPSVLKRNLPIYNNLNKYGHNNFSLAILEDLGHTGSVTKDFMLEREQFYLDILFNKKQGLACLQSYGLKEGSALRAPLPCVAGSAKQFKIK
jgi:hypothetical protein